ncbi:MAG: type I restriction enzyme HsdR N-terminal domain-containing protein [Desulfobulbaceae bacterium]|nr:type I restriction enzyme HsdR N-terminal domain-containing protein [Desulfobulbaceae bacterium]
MSDIPSHHIIYGTFTDYVSGETVVDTDDERYRQKLARFMVEEKGYTKDDLESLTKIETLFSGQFVASRIDLVVSLNEKRFMIIRYGPGSLVTRERPAIAAARVLDPAHRIPLAVVTNGEDAELLDTFTGKIIGKGLDSIPKKEEAFDLIKTLDFSPFPEGKKREREMRILNTFDVEICRTGRP